MFVLAIVSFTFSVLLLKIMTATKERKIYRQGEEKLKMTKLRER